MVSEILRKDNLYLAKLFFKCENKNKSTRIIIIGLYLKQLLKNVHTEKESWTYNEEMRFKDPWWTNSF